MLLTKKNRISLSLLLSIPLFLVGCYKKDLEEFKKVNSWTYEPTFAVPFIEKRITLNDTIPTVPNFTSVTMSDTASVELPGSQTKDTLESIIDTVEFRIRLENSFPFSGKVQIYFADSNNVFTDSLLTTGQTIVSAAPPTKVTHFSIIVDKARYIDLTQKSRKMYVFYDLTTNTINGLNNDYLLVNIGIRAKMSITLK